MTTGDDCGTSGAARAEWRPWIFVAAVSVVVVIVNATSNILEMQRAGRAFHWWEPVTWEVSSALIIVALAPLIGRAVRRWSPGRDNWIRPGLIHLALTVPFSLVHVGAIYLMRNAVYWLMHDHYGFFDDGVVLVLVYEWRKDLLSYATIAAVYWVFDYIAARRRPAPQMADDRIEIRDGGAAVYLAARDILFVEAAGNYIEFHTATKTHLVRGTLASWEERLGQRGFVRIHRARLVNRAHVTAIKPTSSGDVEITLSNGGSIGGSRRYRAALETASA